MRCWSASSKRWRCSKQNFFGQQRAEEDFHQERIAHGGQLNRGLMEPAKQLRSPALGERVDVLRGLGLLVLDPHRDQAFFSEALQRPVDLAEIGAPEVLNGIFKRVLQLISRRRPKAQEAQQCVF
jgi:hypothetical protein